MIVDKILAISTPDDILDRALVAAEVIAHQIEESEASAEEILAEQFIGLLTAERSRCAFVLHEMYTRDPHGKEPGDSLDPAIFDIIDTMLEGKDV